MDWLSEDDFTVAPGGRDVPNRLSLKRRGTGLKGEADDATRAEPTGRLAAKRANVRGSGIGTGTGSNRRSSRKKVVEDKQQGEEDRTTLPDCPDVVGDSSEEDEEGEACGKTSRERRTRLRSQSQSSSVAQQGDEEQKEMKTRAQKARQVICSDGEDDSGDALCVDSEEEMEESGKVVTSIQSKKGSTRSEKHKASNPVGKDGDGSTSDIGEEDDDSDDDDGCCVDQSAMTQEQLESQRKANVAAVMGNLPMRVHRRPLLPSILTVKGAEAVLRRPFKSPHPQGGDDAALHRRLFMRKRFVPWGCKAGTMFSLPKLLVSKDSSQDEEGVDYGEPLVLWDSTDITNKKSAKRIPDEYDDEEELPDESNTTSCSPEQIKVDKMLTRWLRPHQREGVQFMFECVAGLRSFEGKGCILADDMGLGKTLQGITLLWTLLKQGSVKHFEANPICKRAIIVCPTSLVGNWASECEKWLKGKVKALALAESSRDDVTMAINQFLSPRKPYDVLIVSYETFRIHTEKFTKQQPGSSSPYSTCDLLICDEAHRLKNDATLTNQALNRLPCARRVLLSGTPMQNHLDEFFAMVNFCNPGVLGTPAHFRRYYELPILAGREPDATDKQIEKSNERSLELSTIVNEFILRRTNSLLSKHLPPKTIEIVCCKSTELQKDLYKHFLHSKSMKQMISAGDKGAKPKSHGRVLSAITALKKLCNHPKLIYDAIHSMSTENGPDGFEDCGQFFPPGLFDNGRVGRGGMAKGWEQFSGKMAVLARLLAQLRRGKEKDRIVLVSNYTQTLDLFAQHCRENHYPFLRLDGTISVKKRMKLVQAFNDPAQDQFAFLLSSKAGGCGLNLIGGNRLVLFDPDWNPANDKQAAARVWRDGQKKNVFVYRFLATGTIEEKVFQRQLSKEGLQGLVSADGKAKGNLTSSDVLRDLFRFQDDVVSDTFDNCGHESREGMGEEHPQWLQVGHPPEEDLKHWAHHFTLEHLPDEAMKAAGGQDVSFIFSCDIAGKDLTKLDEDEEEEKNQTKNDGSRKPLGEIESNTLGGIGKGQKGNKKRIEEEDSEDEEEDDEEKCWSDEDESESEPEPESESELSDSY